MVPVVAGAPERRWLLARVRQPLAGQSARGSTAADAGVIGAWSSAREPPGQCAGVRTEVPLPRGAASGGATPDDSGASGPWSGPLVMCRQREHTRARLRWYYHMAVPWLCWRLHTQGGIPAGGRASRGSSCEGGAVCWFSVAGGEQAQPSRRSAAADPGCSHRWRGHVVTCGRPSQARRHEHLQSQPADRMPACLRGRRAARWGCPVTVRRFTCLRGPLASVRCCCLRPVCLLASAAWLPVFPLAVTAREDLCCGAILSLCAPAFLRSSEACTLSPTACRFRCWPFEHSSLLTHVWPMRASPPFCPHPSV